MYFMLREHTEHSVKLDRVALLKADPTSANFIQPLSYGDLAKFNRFEYKSQTNVFVESFDFIKVS